mmetsp:Transcript_23648/g.74003  ORF Transcript_23648/g.74003 Transcript_23648/m.74003 type:complete len:402 (-) Transcript_23648:337-1542(-)
MLKRSRRDIDLPSLAPPQFCAASEARQEPSESREARLKRSSQAWDSALLSAYVVESETPAGPTAGLGMGLELLPVGRASEAPKWDGSWSSHREYMRFLFGEEEAPTSSASTGSVGAAAARKKEEEANPEERPSSKRRRVVEAGVEGEDAVDGRVREGARYFAQRTTLRRGFFASALKRQLEALREENRRLKRLAVEVLDDGERDGLFDDLGSESQQRCVVARPADQSNPTDADDDRAALKRVVRDAQEAARADSVRVQRRDLALIEVVQQAQRAFVVTNPALPDNPIVWSSDEFSRLTGYEQHEVCGRNCRFLQGPKTNPKAVDAVRTAINHSHEASVVLLNYRKDGTTFWNRFFIAPLRNAKGDVAFYVGVQTDVTSNVTTSPLLDLRDDHPAPDLDLDR